MKQCRDTPRCLKLAIWFMLRKLEHLSLFHREDSPYEATSFHHNQNQCTQKTMQERPENTTVSKLYSSRPKVHKPNKLIACYIMVVGCNIITLCFHWRLYWVGMPIEATPQKAISISWNQFMYQTQITYRSISILFKPKNFVRNSILRHPKI